MTNFPPSPYLSILGLRWLAPQSRICASYSILREFTTGSIPPPSCIFSCYYRRGCRLGAVAKSSPRCDGEASSSRSVASGVVQSGWPHPLAALALTSPAARIDAYQGPVCNAIQRCAGRDLSRHGATRETPDDDAETSGGEQPGCRRRPLCRAPGPRPRSRSDRRERAYYDLCAPDGR